MGCKYDGDSTELETDGEIVYFMYEGDLLELAIYGENSGLEVCR